MRLLIFYVCTRVGEVVVAVFLRLWVLRVVSLHIPVSPGALPREERGFLTKEKTLLGTGRECLPVAVDLPEK